METTLAQLARDFATAAASAPELARGVVAKGALNVKNQARINAKETSGTHAAKYPDTITYSEPTILGALVESEIGPEKRGQGNLGPILENGSVHNPPHRDLGRALDDEEPRFLAAAAEIALPWR